MKNLLQGLTILFLIEFLEIRTTDYANEVIKHVYWLTMISRRIF